MNSSTDAALLHVFQGEVEWLVAASAEDAAKLAVELFGASAAAECEQDKAEHWSALDDLAPLTIVSEERDAPKETKTCGEWAREAGRGLLCASEV